MFSFRAAFLTLLAGLLITALVPLGVLWAWQRFGTLSITDASAHAVKVVLWVQCVVFFVFAVLRGLQLRRAREEQRKIVKQLQCIGKDEFVYYDLAEFRHMPYLVNVANIAVAKIEKKRTDLLRNAEMMEESLSADEYAGVNSRNYFVEFMAALGRNGSNLPPGRNVLIVFRIHGLSKINLEQGRLHGNKLIADFVGLLKKNSVRMPSEKVMLARLYSADIGLVALGVTPEQVVAWLGDFDQTLRNFQAHGGSVFKPVAFIGVTYFEPREGSAEVLARADDALRACVNSLEQTFKVFDQTHLLYLSVRERRALLARMLEPQNLVLELKSVYARNGQVHYHQAAFQLRLEDGRLAGALDVLQSAAAPMKNLEIDLLYLDAVIARSQQVMEPVALRLEIDNLKRPHFFERMQQRLQQRTRAGRIVLMVPELALDSLELNFAHMAMVLAPLGVSFGVFGLRRQIHCVHQLRAWGFTLAELHNLFCAELLDSDTAQHSLTVMHQLVGDPHFTFIATGPFAQGVLAHPKVGSLLAGYTAGPA
jgi:hypothetical protein